MKKLGKIVETAGKVIKVTSLVGSAITIVLTGTVGGGYAACKFIKKVWVPFWTGADFDI